MSKVEIAGHLINEKSKPFIIAEAGINHNGNLSTALKMVEIAKKIGFEAIKFQTFRASEFNIDNNSMYTYKSQGTQITESMLEMFQRYEFTKDEWIQIKKKCENEEILFLSTPQNFSDLELLLDIGIDAIKIGSDDFTNIPLLKKYRQADLPLMLSCGMADLGEIYTSLETVKAFERDDVALLLCTSEYPTPASDVNLLKLKTLKGAFPGLTLGFSDHTQGYLAAGMAVGFGACIFEKHFTLDNHMEGPDHWFSENPETLKEWFEHINQAWILCGNEILRPTIAEKEMRKLARRSIYIVKNIKQGEEITENHLGMFRPGDGLSGFYWDKVVHMRACCDMDAGHKLIWGDFCDSV